jgi:hypothetical protein
LLYTVYFIFKKRDLVIIKLHFVGKKKKTLTRV